MKKVFLTFLALSLAGCANAPQSTTNANSANTATTVKNNDSSLVSSSHSAGQQPQAPRTAAASDPASSTEPLSKNPRSPMEQPVDTSEMDAAIEKAEKDFKRNPADGTAKIALAEAYFVRATALTEVAQYRAALGDYRRGLKLDPTNAEAKEMQDQIINIFQLLKREPPKEGAEPAPLPYKKS